MNMTGTSQAYRPPGSILASGKRPKATGDYEALAAVGRGGQDRPVISRVAA